MSWKQVLTGLIFRFRLVMQSPKGFVQFLLDEASQNGGKISVAVAMIKKFRLLARTDIFLPLVLKIDARQPTKTVANATLLLKNLVALWREQEQVLWTNQVSISIFADKDNAEDWICSCGCRFRCEFQHSKINLQMRL